MNKKFIMFISVVALVMASGKAYSQQGMTQTTNQAPAQENAIFNVAKLVVCTGVENRVPVGVAETFSASTQKVYAFLDATKITEDTQVTFVWLYNQKEVSKVELPLKRGFRWRTFASKTVSGMKGDWSVELKDAEGNTVKTAQFKIE
jgi:hypothetical protein